MVENKNKKMCMQKELLIKITHSEFLTEGNAEQFKMNEFNDLMIWIVGKISYVLEGNCKQTENHQGEGRLA